MWTSELVRAVGQQSSKCNQVEVTVVLEIALTIALAITLTIALTIALAVRAWEWRVQVPTPASVPSPAGWG